MSAPRTRKRWLEVLRRTAGVGAQDPRPALDDAAIWEARERAALAATEAEKLGERVAATATRQRASIDAAAERAQALVARRGALASDLSVVRDSIDRLAVVGLNAGLEGARTPEPHGKALTLVADEVRGHAARGAEAMRQLDEHVEELMASAAELTQRAERAQRDAQELSQDAFQLKASAQSALGALADLEARLRRATGLDPESAKLLTLASEHAKGLLAALSGLDAANARDAAQALSPVLTPVLKVLGGFLPSDASGNGGGD